jgi:hypothetical protein
MKSSDLFFGTSLVLVGLIFLLNNMGFLDPGIWLTLLRLWPLYLIILGINIIFGRGRLSFIGPLLLALIVIIVIFLYQGQGRDLGLIHGKDIRQDLEPGVIHGELDIKTGATRLDIGAEEGEFLYTGRLTYGRGHPQLNYKRIGERALVFIAPDKRGGNFIRPRLGETRSTLQLGLSTYIPWDIGVSGGVISGDMDLSQLNVGLLKLDSGITSLNMKFGWNSKGAKIRLDGGICKVQLLLPKGLPTRIYVNSALMSGNIKDIGLNKNGKEYTTPGYSQGLDIEISAGISKVDVVFIEGREIALSGIGS